MAREATASPDSKSKDAEVDAQHKAGVEAVDVNRPTAVEDDRAVPAPEKPEPDPLAPGPRRLGYVRALDGIRGLAVLAVLLFHGGVSWATGGFLGVDVFFVLSGFLITTLLLEELAETRTVRLRLFWTRRARRLLPALVVVAVFVALFPKLVALDRPVSTVRKDAASALAYIANWRFVAAGASYFERTGTPSPLKHTWSLAVEEQFYLVWPLLVLLVARGRRLWLGVLAVVGTVASAVAMGVLYHPGADPSRVYYGTDTHVQVVLVGAVLAVLLTSRRLYPGKAIMWTRPGKAVLTVMAVAGLAAVGWVLTHVDGTTDWLYRGGFAGVGLVTALVIAAVVLHPAGVAARVLSLWPLKALGRISYGVYLWHWPLFFVITRARTGLTGTSLLGARLAVSVAVAALSAWIIEHPIRVGRLLPGWRAGIVLPAVAATAAAIVFATTLSRDGKPLLASVIPVDDTPTSAPPSAGPSTSTVAPKAIKVVRPPRAAGAPARLMMVGDSVALTLGDALQPYMRQAGLDLRNEGILGCGVVRGGPFRYFGNESANPKQCETWPTRWANDVTKDDPDVVFVIVGRWEVMDRVFNGRWVHLGDPAFDDYIASELDRSVDVLSAKGALVAFATAPYYFRGEAPDGSRWPEDDPARVDQFNQILQGVVARHADRATIIDLGGHTSVDGRYTRSLDGVQLRYDGVHFTPQAGRWMAPWLLPQLSALAPTQAGPGSIPATTTTTPGSRTRSTTTSTTSTTVRRRGSVSTTTTTIRPTRTIS